MAGDFTKAKDQTERRLARETSLYRSHRGLDLSMEPPSPCPRTSTGLKIGGLFRALYIVMVGDIVETQDRAAKIGGEPFK